MKNSRKRAAALQGMLTALLVLNLVIGIANGMKWYSLALILILAGANIGASVYVLRKIKEEQKERK